MKKIYALTILTSLALASVALAEHGGRGHGKRLERLDANKDGKITLQEMKNEVSARFAELDTNRDGVVDKKEFESKVEARFARKDANGDRVLDADELRHRRGKHGGWHKGAKGHGNGAAGAGAGRR